MMLSKLWVYGNYKCFNSFSAGTSLYTSESDVYRRQILTYKVGPHAERAKSRLSTPSTHAYVDVSIRMSSTIRCIAFALLVYTSHFSWGLAIIFLLIHGIQ